MCAWKSKRKEYYELSSTFKNEEAVPEDWVHQRVASRQGFPLFNPEKLRGNSEPPGQRSSPEQEYLLYAPYLCILP